jgi:hypothetical protein
VPSLNNLSSFSQCNHSSPHGVWLNWRTKNLRTSKHRYFASILTLLLACGLAAAQSRSTPTLSGPVQPPASLEATTREYQTRSEELVRIQESEVNNAAAKLEELRRLVAEGLVAKVELEESEQLLATQRSQLETTRKEIADFNQKIALAKSEQELEKAQAAAVPAKLNLKPFGSSLTKPTLLRYNGSGAWSIGNLAGIQSFFYNEFGRSLPTSAVGQSSTHDRLGYDHRNAVDVALHPDSAQGKVLINYLQNQSIPFLAFRAAVPGVATGAHIHIGNASHRI